MKKIALFLAVFLAVNLMWMGFVREPLPAIPNICAEISREVPLHFSIKAMDYTGVELGLNRKIGGGDMHVQFRMNNAWKTGRPGLVLTGIKSSGGFKGGMSAKQYLEDPERKKKSGKDFSNFMQDKGGKALMNFSFQQALSEDNSGKLYMRISYDGPAREMIQSLEIPRPVTVPAHISKQFTDKGIIQFQRGTVAFDRKIKGFYIPVVIR